MKFLPLLWAGIWRKPGRTLLMLFSIFNSFVLFGLLQGFASGLNSARAQAHADMLLTFSRVSQFEPLPLAHLAKLRAVPGVRAVSPVLSLDGFYGSPGQYVGAFGVDAEQLPTTTPAMDASPDIINRLRQRRTGALVSTALAGTYGWKIGDRIPIRSITWVNKDGSPTWPLDVVGVFRAKNSVLLANSILYNYDYVDKGRTSGNGTTTGFLVRIYNPDNAGKIASEIDRMFANSLYETRTSSEEQLAQNQVRQIGDVGFVATAIVSAVFASLLFSISIMLAQSARERTSEFAVLKTIGFSDTGVLALVLGESSSLFVAASALGLLAAVVIFPWAKRAFGFAAVEDGGVFFSGLLLALGVALASGLFPALRMMRLNVVDALAGR